MDKIANQKSEGKTNQNSLSPELVRNAFVVSSLNKDVTRNEAAANNTIESNNSNPAAKGIRFKPYDKKQLEKILTSIDMVKVGANVVE